LRIPQDFLLRVLPACLPAQVTDIKQDIAGWKNHVMWIIAEEENKKGDKNSISMHYARFQSPARLVTHFQSKPHTFNSPLVTHMGTSCV